MGRLFPVRGTGFQLLAGAALLVGGIVGCESYAPMPATPADVSKSLEPMGHAELAKAAAGLRHPALAPVVIAEDGSLTPRGAAVVAVVQNPPLRAARSRRGVAAAQVVQAGILPNPQLGASVDFPVSGSTAGTVNGYSLGATWDVSALAAHSAGRSAAERNAESVELDLAWEEWQTALAAKLHATRVLWLTAQRAELAQQVKWLGDVAGDAEVSVQRGLVTGADRDSAAVALGKRRGALLAADASLRSEASLLRKALGLPEGGPDVRVAADGDEGEAPPPSAEELSRMIDESRLDLAALRAGYASQEDKLRGAVLGQFPKIGLGITRARDTGNVGTVGFGVTLDLPLFDRGQGRVAVEKATRQQLFDELAARTFEARADAARAYAELAGIGAQIDTAEKTAATLQTLVSGLEAARGRGDADIVQLNQARNDLGEARAEALRLRQERAELRIAVEAATGRQLGGEKP